jgi:hypothetical protein
MAKALLRNTSHVTMYEGMRNSGKLASQEDPKKKRSLEIAGSAESESESEKGKRIR